MLPQKLKEKLKPLASQLMPGQDLSLKSWKEQAAVAADHAMQRLFSLPKNWHLERDIIKNNYALGLKHYRDGRYSDAVLRFKFTTWLDPQHADGWYWLARASLSAGKRKEAIKALGKAVALEHKDAALLLAAATAEKFIASLKPCSDAALLASLHAAAFQLSWPEKEIAARLAITGTHGWVVGTEALAMGMAMARLSGEQYEILTMAVAPEWRRHGIARKLLGHAKADAKKSGAKTMFLEVADDNLAAQRLYGQEGFAEISRRKDYYKNADGGFTDAIVMRLEFAA